ncbi:MAG TPA: MBL fold metallo-hydrolase [Acidimicrobiia bacterium]|nr:MBL fold metallo-hydrolase [Acidimicrobiia bacterium]
MRGPLHIDTDVLAVRKLCVGPFENNVYVVACRATGAAIVVDAADEADRIVGACDGLDVAAIVTTHGHWDHIQAAEAVRDRLDVALLVHPADAGDLPGTAPIPEVVEVGDLRFEARHLPGHTPGSTCIIGHDLAFTGDTLFPGGPGATSGPDAFATIMRSIRTGLFTLPDVTLVLPGHGLDTTIGTERPHLDEWERRGF